jgi:NarL family two-component system response regulator LiaR
MNPICKVAIIDDHPLFLTILKDILNQTGEYEVIGVATNGKAALELCQQSRPDVVFVDLMLPGISGLELITVLRRELPEAKLVAFSGLETKEAVHLAIIAGAQSYISKSISVDEFLQKLQALPKGQAKLSLAEAETLRWVVRERRIYKEIGAEELEVLRLFAHAMSVKEIADRTQLSDSAVYKILQKNKRRFDLRSYWDLRLFTERLGLAACAQSEA